MKNRTLAIVVYILMILPIPALAQDITGLWRGQLYNDTTQKYLHYELAISEDNGKLSGYSYTIFDINGKQEVGVKQLKIKRKDDKILIEDDGVIANNYSVQPPKGVHQYSVVSLKNEDSVLVLSGTWNTNRTKKYRSLTGTLRLQRKNDFKQAPLLKALDSMQLSEKLSFVEPQKKQEPVAVVEKPKAKVPEPVTNKQPNAKEPEPVAVTEQPKTKAPEVVAADEVQQLPGRKTETVVVEKRKETPAAVIKKIEPAIIQPVVIPAAAQVAKRKVATTQTVFFKSDSLTLTLYDNGEVDGDTVSVLMNGELIFAKQRLTTRANSKTIHINKDTPDSLLLVMYAENLGTIPPNTGLLVVHDGESIYELRFSADLQTNAQIIFRRKNN